MLQIAELNDFSQFQNLRDRWNNVLSASKNNEIFLTWEWLSSWWRVFGKGRQQRILLARDKGKIVAIAPLMRTKYHFLHFGNLAKIELIGCPQSDYNNFILVDKETNCLKLFFDRLIGSKDWDCLELREIPESSVSVDVLRRLDFEKSVGKLQERQISVCPYMSLPSSIDILVGRFKGDMRRNLRRRMKRLGEKFRVEFKTQDDFDSVEEAMNIFFKLHQKRWRTKGVSGVFAGKALQDFHFNVARLFNEKGWLGLYFLTVNDDPIGAIYSFDYEQKKYEYLTGFDPTYSKYSVGNLLRLHVAEDCIRRGFREYDLMRGDELYKSKWCTKSRKNLEMRLFHKGLFAKVYGWVTGNGTALRLTERLGHSLTPEQ